MPRLFFTYVLLFLAGYFIVFFWLRRKHIKPPKEDASSRHRFRSKFEKGVWIQAYDTGLLEDATKVLARLEEEEIDCILYEQGRKDVHGNSLKGYGVAVPKTALSRAQTVISRMPV